jgi:hypothetical protein
MGLVNIKIFIGRVESLVEVSEVPDNVLVLRTKLIMLGLVIRPSPRLLNPERVPTGIVLARSAFHNMTSTGWATQQMTCENSIDHSGGPDIIQAP